MVYVIAALVAAIVGYFTWRVQRGRGVKSARLPQIQGARPSSVRIVALGHKEAGKTILLASMWRELAIEGSRRIRMVTELSGDERELQRICNEIERSGDSFPSGTLTGETTEWNFLLQATNPVGQPVDVLRFS